MDQKADIARPSESVTILPYPRYAEGLHMTPREKDIIFYALAGLFLLAILYLMIGYLFDAIAALRISASCQTGQ